MFIFSCSEDKETLPYDPEILIGNGDFADTTFGWDTLKLSPQGYAFIDSVIHYFRSYDSTVIDKEAYIHACKLKVSKNVIDAIDTSMTFEAWFVTCCKVLDAVDNLSVVLSGQYLSDTNRVGSVYTFYLDSNRVMLIILDMDYTDRAFYWDTLKKYNFLGKMY